MRPGLAGAVAVVLLVGLLLASSVAAVYARHEARRQFVELEGLHRERDELNIEWGRLRLEYGTWANPGRVEQRARDKLGMKAPDPGDVVIHRP